MVLASSQASSPSRSSSPQKVQVVVIVKPEALSSSLKQIYPGSGLQVKGLHFPKIEAFEKSHSSSHVTKPSLHFLQLVVKIPEVSS